MKVAHLNVRSITCREHYHFLTDLIVIKDFDIFTISEYWLDSSASDAEIQISGYNIYRLDRVNKPGGGVCVYTKQHLKVERLDDLSAISPSGLHQLWLRIQIRNFRSFIICTTYRPPCSQLALDTELPETLVSALSFNKPIVILGDLNCKVMNENDPGCIAFSNF